MASNLITRAVLKTRAAQRANTSGYVDAAVNGELSQLIDTSCGKLHNLLTELYEDYNMQRREVALVANQAVYPLPADFLKMRAVHYLTPNSAAPADLTQATGVQLNQLDASEYRDWNTSTGTPQGFTVEGSNLIVVPTPTLAGYYLGLKYIPQYVPPVNDNTPISFAFAFGWEDWVVNDVCIDIRIKSMMPTQELMQRNAQFEERVRIQAKNRNATQPHRVRNTGWSRGGGRGGRGDFSFTL